MEQYQPAGLAPGGRHQGGAVFEPCPGLLLQFRLLQGQHLARHRHLVRRFDAEERAARFEGGNLFGLIPGQRAAEDTAAVSRELAVPEIGFTSPELLTGEQDVNYFVTVEFELRN